MNIPAVFHINNTDVRTKYMLGGRIGQGSYGTVVLGTDAKNGQQCAIKIISKNSLARTNELIYARRELEVLAEVDHVHIVKVIELFENSKEICICMELLCGGDIIDRLKAIGRPFTGNETKKYLKGIFEAIHYLHERRIAHRDLKPENLLFDSAREEAIIKLIDFGFAKNLTTHGALHSPCGTPGYSPKELISKPYRSTRTYTMAVDMFALGCVAYCMLFANPPFMADADTDDDDIRAAEIDKKVISGLYEFPESIPLSPEGKDFVERLLATQPEERMTASEALKHPWLTGVTYQPPRKGDMKTTLTQENSRVWLEQHLKRPIKTFSTSEKNREKQNCSTPRTYYRNGSQDYDSDDDISFLFTTIAEPHKHMGKWKHKNLQKKLQIDNVKDHYITDLFFHPYYSSSDTSED